MKRFDKENNRYGTNSIKFDLIKEENKPAGTIPMWVADMDFMVPDCVREAVTKVAQHGIYGYSYAPESYYHALINWFKTRFDFSLEKEWVVTTPGVVTAVGMAVRAYTNPGDSVMIQRPVYYPFSMMIERNDRKVVNSPLINDHGYYRMDMEDFEKKIVEEKVKLFVLCSPHNPIGRVWTKEELTQVATICKKHGVLVVSDEIHCDFVFDGRKHYNFLSILPECKDFALVCTAPSKTFNLAGMQTSNIIIPNEEMRNRFKAECDAVSVGGVTPMGIAACEAAYTGGAEWLDQLKLYIQGNRDYMKAFLAENFPKLVMSELEGTYLVWVDMRSLGLTNEELKKYMLNECKLWLDDGDMFGAEGEGFMRFNIACTRKTLEKALLQMKGAFDKLS